MPNREMLTQTNKLLRLTFQDYLFPKLSLSQLQNTLGMILVLRGIKWIYRPNVCQHFTSFIHQHDLQNPSENMTLTWKSLTKMYLMLSEISTEHQIIL